MPICFELSSSVFIIIIETSGFAIWIYGMKLPLSPALISITFPPSQRYAAAPFSCSFFDLLTSLIFLLDFLFADYVRIFIANFRFYVALVETAFLPIMKSPSFGDHLTCPGSV